MGAWIETPATYPSPTKIAVAPFMGAWIETAANVGVDAESDSRTLHGCVD